MVRIWTFPVSAKHPEVVVSNQATIVPLLASPQRSNRITLPLSFDQLLSFPLRPERPFRICRELPLDSLCDRLRSCRRCRRERSSRRCIQSIARRSWSWERIGIAVWLKRPNVGGEGTELVRGS